MESTTLIAQKIKEFEEMEWITPSANWDADLNIKLHLAQSNRVSMVKNYSVLLVVLTLVNVAFILISTQKRTEKSISKNDDFQKLTNELLITTNN